MPDGDGEPVLSVVVPAYNEAQNIRDGVLGRLAEFLESRPYSHEVVLSDDGSEDETASLVEGFAKEHATFRLLRNPHRGKAPAVLSGMQAAQGRYVLFMDTDLATALEHVEEAVRALEGGADVVIGSREAKGAVRLDAPWSRRFLGKTFNLLIQALLLPGFWDTQCGFKGFRREAARDIIDGMVVFRAEAPATAGPRVTAFDVELLVVARERGYRIVQLPVVWRHIKTRRVRLLRESFGMLRELLAIKRARLRGAYRPVARTAREGEYRAR